MNNNQNIQSFFIKLPKIDIKKFDHVQKIYGNKDLLHQSKQLRKYHSYDNIIKGFYINNNFNSQQNLSNSSSRFSSIDILSNSKIRNKSTHTFGQQYKIKIQYQNKPVSFFKSVLKQKQSNPQIQDIDFKAKARQVDKSSIIQKTSSRLRMVKSEPKIKIQQITKYQNWKPLKAKSRQLQNLRIQRKLKPQKLENSFFLKCRQKSVVMRLSVIDQKVKLLK